MRRVNCLTHYTVATVRKQERQLFHRTSPMILKVEKFAKLVAPSDMSVMILGANGTGKESVAQTIHDNSERYGKPFVAVNCGALPRELAASLFFGHEKGASSLMPMPVSLTSNSNLPSL